VPSSQAIEEKNLKKST